MYIKNKGVVSPKGGSGSCPGIQLIDDPVLRMSASVEEREIELPDVT